MAGKKRLIRRLAWAAASVLATGLGGILVASGVRDDWRQTEVERVQRERVALAEKARADLADIAPRIDRLPVDPSLVGSIQAAYLEKRATGRRFLWAMDTDGGFLFGVPREDFARLNAVFDANEAQVREHGFVDRQDLLRRVIQSSDEIARGGSEPDTAQRLQDLLSRWSYQGDREGWLLLSAPLVNGEGASLGNLYLKVEDVRPKRRDDVVEALLVTPIVASVASLLFLWFLLPTWVYVDARERGVARAPLWSFLALVSLVVGLVVYLIARPEGPATLRCPGCGSEVDGGAFCPHCGHDLGASFCDACRYPLKPDWAFCPSCRAETRRAQVSESLPEPTTG